jgi:hypothetical protein
MRAAFATDDYPGYSCEVELSDVLKQRLDRQEPNRRRGTLEMLYSWHPVALILDAYSPPDIPSVGREFERASKHVFQPLPSLGEHLERVPPRENHYADDPFNIFLGDLVMEQIAHGVDKDHSRLFPLQGLGKLFRNNANIEAFLEGVSCDSAKTLSKAFCIAILAACADFGAAPHRVPRCVGPFDRGAKGHDLLLLKQVLLRVRVCRCLSPKVLRLLMFRKQGQMIDQSSGIVLDWLHFM